jgi:hypothetical protein
MRSLLLSVSVCPPYNLKAGIVETEETVVTRQRLDKDVPAATNTLTTI